MRWIFLIFLVITFSACEADHSSSESHTGQTEQFQVQATTISRPRLPLVPDRPIRNVILVIADGTGISQISSGQLNTVGEDGNLYLQTMPVTGMVKTHAFDNLITDSAAGATAYSCGIKTNNGVIGQDPEERKCTTITELAIQKGMATGLVATSTITHATPASFASHVKSRKLEAEIASQFLDSGVDVFLGGGREFFIPQTKEASKRDDNRDLMQEFAGAGYRIVETASELKASEHGKLLGLFSIGGMGTSESEPTLQEMTQKALDIVSENDSGFFLMVEASQIDWAGHRNDIAYMLREVDALDQTMASILEFAANDGETLVILTADHETGGLTLTEHQKDSNRIETSWASTHHTGTPILLSAYGPHAMQFSGWWDNTEVGRKVASLMGFEPFPVVEN
ncbi:MAG: alkaline phosphatase [Bacteroidota bacterium]